MIKKKNKKKDGGKQKEDCSNKEKKENTFVMVKSSKNLCENGRRGRETSKAENMAALCRKGNMADGQDGPFQQRKIKKGMK